MSDVVIRVENLGKLYRIGAPEPYKTLRDSLTGAFTQPFRRLRTLWSGNGASPPDSTNNTFWALKDVSFEVKRGEVIGIIGGNGAGKSTLLKILSRITEPTEGFAEIRGRVRSLLEVGTGFHPELTGRENIYLNGAILGMRKAEIQRKFDEIVAFSEVEKFIDTPVKHYSSGMYVRLAFAVAAHLEPEILIVDEVLSVGDAQFQKKCLGKMDDVAKEGRTVLFVSHSMGAVTAICQNGILLENGLIKQIGTALEIVNTYLYSISPKSCHSLRNRKDRKGSGQAKVTEIYLSSFEGKILESTISGLDCMLVIGYESEEKLRNPNFKITIYNQLGQPIAHFDSSLPKEPLENIPTEGHLGCKIKKLPLSSGYYKINVAIINGNNVLDHIIDAFSFTVSEGDFFGSGRNIVGLSGICLIDQEWLIITNSSRKTI